eukprot:SAG31_NODE_150_length_22290_cov_5.975801_12_plen_160_part_00
MYTAVRRTNWGRTNCHAHRLLRARQRSVLLAAVVCLPLLPCSAAPAAPAGPRHGDQGVGGGSSGGVLRGGGRPSGALLLLPMEPGSGAAAAFRTRSGDAQPLASALGTSLSMLLATGKGCCFLSRSFRANTREIRDLNREMYGTDRESVTMCSHRAVPQ